MDDDAKEDEIVNVYDEGLFRGLWQLGRVERIVRSSDKRIRGAHVQVQS